MKYISQINAFYDALETNPLSTSAIALWHALMHINNKAGWVNEFAVAASVLSVKTGLSERTISNARNDLKQKGFIDFKSRTGNRSATYTITKLYETLPANISDNISDNPLLSEINADSVSDSVSDNVSDNVSDSVSDSVSTLIRLDKTREENKDINNSAPVINKSIEIYTQERFGMMTEITRDILVDLINRFGDDAVCRAMKEAIKSNARNLRYVEMILVNQNKVGEGKNARSKREVKQLERPSTFGTGWLGRS